MQQLTIKAANGIDFNVIRLQNERSPVYPAVEVGGQALIEFYDTRYPHSEYGQFVSRYYVDTIINHDKGLDLVGYEPNWKIDNLTMSFIRGWLTGIGEFY